MDNYCREFWICSSVPAKWDLLIAIIVSLLFITLVAVPVANILHRAGRSRWWTIIHLSPFSISLACGCSRSAGGPHLSSRGNFTPSRRPNAHTGIPRMAECIRRAVLSP